MAWILIPAHCFGRFCNSMARCYTDDYNTYAGAAWFAGVVYAVGVPAVFMLLINKFKHHGRRGDKLVQKALGPS